MKKILSSLIAILILAGTLPMIIYANAVDGVVLSVSEVTGEAGDIVDVIISVSENSNIAGFTISLGFDNQKLEFQVPTGTTSAKRRAYTNNTVIADSMYNVEYFLANFMVEQSKVKVTVLLYEEEQLSAGGSLLNFKFKIKDGWSGDSAIELISGPEDTVLAGPPPAPGELNPEIPFTANPGKVSVAATEVMITFDAAGGTGGWGPTSMQAGAALTAPDVTREGFIFFGWSPAVPPVVPEAPATYTAQWRIAKPAVTVTKTLTGMAVSIEGWTSDYQYQIWGYQKIVTDSFLDNLVETQAEQWILMQPYTTCIPDTNGNVEFSIEDFVSPDDNYTIAVRVADENNNFVKEYRDSYTPEDLGKVVITKVLVDDEYSTGSEIKEIKAGAEVLIKAIGNNVVGTSFTAKVKEEGTWLSPENTNEFLWDISGLKPGIYTVEITASNGETTDTKTIEFRLYSLDESIQYANITDMEFDLGEDARTVTINPSFTDGSFYFSVGEPGRKASNTIGLFSSTDNISYTFTQPGVYQIRGYVNPEDEIRIGGYYDDGIIRNIVIPKSTSSTGGTGGTGGTGDPVDPAVLALNSNVSLNDVAKGTPVVFTATSSLSGAVQFSFWRYDAKGLVLVKDWSSDNTLDWTPARVGNYTIEVRAKGAQSGSYEEKMSVAVNVTDTSDEIAAGVSININEAELNANATARAPIAIKASATSTNTENLLYKFYVNDEFMGTSTLQGYSTDQNCIWTPRKPGTYTISVLVKNDVSFGAYDAMEQYEITVK